MSDEQEFTPEDDYVAPPPATNAIIPAQPAEPEHSTGQQIQEHRPHRGEVSITSQGAVAGAMAAQAMAETRLMMEMAVLYPRDEADATVRIHKACQSLEFADKALYSFKRGGKNIEGPSVYLAKELGKLWKNLKWGATTLDDTADLRTIRCYAWDLEGNAREEQDVTFTKLIQRKISPDKSIWVDPNPDQLFELHNRSAAKGVRNCILSMVPRQVVRDAVSWCKQRLAQAMDEDPDAFRKRLTIAFGKVGVSPKELEAYLGKKLESIHPKNAKDKADYTALQGIYRRLDDGDATWQQILQEKATELGVEGPAPTNAADLRSRVGSQAEKVRSKK